MNSRILILALVSAALSSSVFSQTPVVPDPAPPPEPASAAAATHPEATVAELAEAGPGDAAAGASKSAACGACHGMDGNSSDPQYPKIAGQHERYIARQLALFKSGTRANPVMLGFSATLSDQDMRDIGAHFATQKASPGTADEAVIEAEYSPYKGERIVDVGRSIYQGGVKSKGVPACMACHGPSGSGNPGPSFPALAGQHAGYTVATLQLYKAVAQGDPRAEEDANYSIMVDIAKRLSEEEILAVSSYLEGLHARTNAAAATSQP